MLSTCVHIWWSCSYFCERSIKLMRVCNTVFNWISIYYLSNHHLRRRAWVIFSYKKLKRAKLSFWNENTFLHHKKWGYPLFRKKTAWNGGKVKKIRSRTYFFRESVLLTYLESLPTKMHYCVAFGKKSCSFGMNTLISKWRLLVFPSKPLKAGL